MSVGGVVPARQGQLHRMIWRWHFYAGLFCIPFVIWLAVTGAIFLFKPQIDALIDWRFDSLPLADTPKSATEQVRAALAAVPGGTLRAYELPQTPHSAIRVLIGREAELTRVYVEPTTLQILKIVNEDRRFTKLVSRLHGELMLGDAGSMVVELAASWAIVMIVTGLYLWWPRQVIGLGGIVYPRLRRGSRTVWRDLHAVTGFWISTLVLFQLLSGLPWARSWGGYFKEIRQITGTATARQDWTTGRSSEIASRLAMDMDDGTARLTETGSHAGHGAGGIMTERSPPDYAALDKIVETVTPLGLAFPVEISPPRKAGSHWTARSETQNRPLRVELTLDADSGAVLTRTDFHNRAPIDRAVAVGIAAHEGQLFGWLNQLVSVFMVGGLLTLCASAIVLWWRRRPSGLLGAPEAPQSIYFPMGLIIGIAAFGILLPLLGGSILTVVLIERLVLGRIPHVREWLGLSNAIKG